MLPTDAIGGDPKKQLQNSPPGGGARRHKFETNYVPKAHLGTQDNIASTASTR